MLNCLRNLKPFTLSPFSQFHIIFSAKVEFPRNSRLKAFIWLRFFVHRVAVGDTVLSAPVGDTLPPTPSNLEGELPTPAPVGDTLPPTPSKLEGELPTPAPVEDTRPQTPSNLEGELSLWLMLFVITIAILEGVADGQVEGEAVLEARNVVPAPVGGLIGQVEPDAQVGTNHQHLHVEAQSEAGAHG